MFWELLKQFFPQRTPGSIKMNPEELRGINKLKNKDPGDLRDLNIELLATEIVSGYFVLRSRSAPGYFLFRSQSALGSI